MREFGDVLPRVRRRVRRDLRRTGLPRAKILAVLVRLLDLTGLRIALAEVLDVVAQTLHNTPAVCREFYVHPALVEAYLGGRLDAMIDRAGTRQVRELRRSEARFLALLEQGAETESKS